MNLMTCNVLPIGCQWLLFVLLGCITYLSFYLGKRYGKKESKQNDQEE